MLRDTVSQQPLINAFLFICIGMVANIGVIIQIAMFVFEISDKTDRLSRQKDGTLSPREVTADDGDGQLVIHEHVVQLTAVTSGDADINQWVQFLVFT